MEIGKINKQCHKLYYLIQNLLSPDPLKLQYSKGTKKVILGSMQKKNYLKILWILELSMTKLCHFELNLRLDNEKINFCRPRI